MMSQAKATALTLMLLTVFINADCPSSFVSGSLLTCVTSIVCSGQGSSAVGALQQCSSNFYSQKAAGPITNHSQLRNRQANSIKGNSEFFVAQFSNILISGYYSSSSTTEVDVSCSVVDYEAISLNGSDFILVLCSNQAYLQSVPQVAVVAYSSTVVSTSVNNLLKMNHTLTKSLWLSGSELAVIGTLSGHILLLNITSMQITQQVQACSSSITSLQVLTGSDWSKIYCGSSEGQLRELLWVNNALEIERKSLFGNTMIFDMEVSSNKYLITSSSNGILTQINLETGHLMDSRNSSVYQAGSSIGLTLIKLSDLQYYVFNVQYPHPFSISVSSGSANSSLVLYCSQMNYYSSSAQNCQPCSQTCSECDPSNGQCTSCISGYFLSSGECKSCYYQEGGVLDHADQCFSSLEQDLMDNSKVVVQALSVVVSNFAAFLKLFGLLFLFLKIVNYWNLISIYVLVPIDKTPFFLSNVLAILFKTLNTAVLQRLGIQLTLNLGQQNRAWGTQLEAIGGTTDFIAFNSQNIILFFYALVLIMTVYQLLNFCLMMCSVSLFDDNHYMAILEEFVGSFTTSLIPLYYIVVHSGNRNPMDKLNSLCFYLLTGLAVLAPFFFFLIQADSPTPRSNKVTNMKDPKAIEALISSKLNRQLRQWITEANRERCFSALLSFSIALLACHHNSSYFLIIVGAAHLLSIYNSLYTTHWRISTVTQKVLFFGFHVTFGSLIFVDSPSTQLNLSILAVILILAGGIHQILITFLKKAHFLYVLVKGKLQTRQKIDKFFLQNHGKGNSHRSHAVAFSPSRPQEYQEYQVSRAGIKQLAGTQVKLSNLKMSSEVSRRHLKSCKDLANTTKKTLHCRRPKEADEAQGIQGIDYAVKSLKVKNIRRLEG